MEDREILAWHDCLHSLMDAHRQMLDQGMT